MAKSTTKSTKQYRNKIDSLRREYIRKRDLDFRGGANCISCGKYKYLEHLQVGHFYVRNHDFTTELGMDERNVNLQCDLCNGNMFNRKVMVEKGYNLGMEAKYGHGVLQELEEKYKTKKYYRIADYEALIEKYGGTN